MVGDEVQNFLSRVSFIGVSNAGKLFCLKIQRTMLAHLAVKDVSNLDMNEKNVLSSTSWCIFLKKTCPTSPFRSVEYLLIFGQESLIKLRSGDNSFANVYILF